VSDASPDRPPFAARGLEVGVVAFAAFTVVTNACVAVGASLDALLLVCAAGIAVALVSVAMRSRRGGAGPATPLAPPPGLRQNRAQSAGLRSLLIGGALAAATTGALFESILAWWAIALPTFAAALWGEARTDVAAPAPMRSAFTDRLLVALAVLFACVVSIAQRADADDAFYVNLVLAAAARPDAPLLAGDTLHGYPGVAMALPVFEVLSWEVLQAAIVRLTGASTLTVTHVVVPPLVALIVPLAWARLATRLLPASWPWAVVCVVIGLLAVGDGRAGHGDFGLLRLHQGKSVMLHIALPLCTAFAIEYGMAPSRWGLVRLAAAQIAAVGLSASGLWLGPVAAGLGLLATTPLRPRALRTSWRTLAAGLCASAYPVALALLLRGETLRAMSEAPRPLDGASWDGPRLMEHAADLVLGSGPYRWIALLALVAATASSGSPMARRFGAIAGAAFVVVLFDPLTAPFVANGVTGADTYFRVFWALPLPLLVASLLVEPLVASLPGRLDRPSIRRAGAAITALFVLVAAPRFHTLSAENGTRLATPGPRLPPDELAAARTINRLADPDHFVLAPLAVARWIPLVEGHPKPLMVRELYLDRLAPLLGREELDRRRALAHLVGGAIRPRAGEALLADAIERYPLEVVAVAGPALGWPGIRRALRESPLEVAERTADLEIWVRGPSAGP